jgi:CxxC motif-containing protein (DUF1111 family)
LTNSDAFSFQMANSPENHERPFSFGNRLFNTNWVEAPASVKSFDGLGPLFNRVSCAGSHTKDGRGAPPADGNGPMDSLLLRVSIPGIGPHGGPLPTLQTGDVAAFPELANQTIHPYTDLLLHDMGEALADHRPDFEAKGTEWRTPPLWGLGLVTTVNGHNTLLHDGRARGFEEAILWHGGEAEKAKENFRKSSKDVREKLIAFLSSL